MVFHILLSPRAPGGGAKNVCAIARPIYLSNSHTSPADAGLDLDLWYIETILTDYDSQHLQASESS